jgi:glycosyltransferase involved in cell wall biosynthesis
MNPTTSKQYVPKVSVVMAVYNKAPYLRESVESVLRQDLEEFELICVDVASTDNSLEILKEYASKDPRITIFSTPYSKIPAVTKNIGIDSTRGEYVFNLDADDYLRADTLKEMYTKAKETNADAVIPDLQTVSLSGRNIQPFISGVNGNRSILLTNRQAVTESLDWTIHGFALWKGDLIRRIRLEEFGAYSDEYSARVLFFNCKQIAFCGGLYFHRINDQSLTGKISLQMYDRPDAIYRVASFIEKQLFDEKNVNSLHFSVFKDCCFLLCQTEHLTASELAEAQIRIKTIYDQIDMGRVRKSVCTLTPGRAAIWKPAGRVGKYIFAFLTFFEWGLLNKLPLKLLFIS